MRNVIISSALVIMLGASGAAVAAKVVKDPWNLARNAVSAAQNQKQTAELVVSNMHQYNQYVTMLKNLKNMSASQVNAVIQRGVANGLIKSTTPDAALNEALGVYGNYQQLHQTMNGMGGIYDQLTKQVNDMDRLSANSGLSWEQLIETEREAARAGQTASAQNYMNLQSLLNQLGNFQTRADSLANRIPLNQGALESLSTLSAQNHLISDQLSGLLQASVSQAQAANLNLQRQSMEDEVWVKEQEASRERQKQIEQIFIDKN